jgi:uncharacterized BrkB/YihY/UPF0761 family membrane protein
VREIAREVVRHVRRHDLLFYAAGLTFHVAVAVVLLVAWFVTSLALGDELVTTLTLAPGRVGPDLARAQDRRAGAAGQGAAGGLLALVFVAGGLVS